MSQMERINLYFTVQFFLLFLSSFLKIVFHFCCLLLAALRVLLGGIVEYKPNK